MVEPWTFARNIRALLLSRHVIIIMFEDIQQMKKKNYENTRKAETEL